jgi:hypothetical protein
MLKYRPKQFWGMLKPAHSQNPDLPTAALAQFNRQIFFDESIPDEDYTPIIDKTANYITTDELT